jgi:steroid delta-isomerase-like uncharacterized protein
MSSSVAIRLPRRPDDGHPIRSFYGLEVNELLSAGDRVVARWTGSGTHEGELMGVPPTGASIKVDALSIFRIADGKIAEEWTVWDALGLLQQVGAVAAPA